MLTKRWQYDVVGRVFKDTQTERVLDTGRLNQLLGDFISSQLQRANRVTQELIDGYTTLLEWEIDMRRIVKETFGASYLLGRGGRNVMDFHNWGSVGRSVRDQYLWLNMFAREIASGMVSAEQAQQRAAHYVGAARQAFSRARASAYGDVPLPAHPGDGSTACHGNCTCSWQIEESPAGGWNASWIRGGGGQSTCGDCVKRSQEWAPLWIGGPART